MFFVYYPSRIKLGSSSESALQLLWIRTNHLGAVFRIVSRWMCTLVTGVFRKVWQFTDILSVPLQRGMASASGAAVYILQTTAYCFCFAMVFFCISFGHMLLAFGILFSYCASLFLVGALIGTVMW
ncbi:hypothetical protein L6452_29034 [Arctium lappa]|uniref:Uncharacterized protein n=1 Tax=Arctium lappa TaxID=4217 RepID=A0ACB8ZGC1_ARCLA|nr:hypothetical protein L6452_29034 [Arctium lappa]